MGFEPIILDPVEEKVVHGNQHTPGRLIIDVAGSGFADTRITLVTNIGKPTGATEFDFPLMTVVDQQEVWSGTLGSLLNPENGNGITTSQEGFIAFYAAMYPLFMQTVKDLVASGKATLKQTSVLEK